MSINYVYVFRVLLRMDRDFLHKQHSIIVLHNADAA
jgi:hypothetical protein